MGDSERGLAPASGAKKIKYGRLRQTLLDDYTARGNRSLKVRSDGSATIAGLKQLDDFFESTRINPVCRRTGSRQMQRVNSRAGD